jgi:MOSC domain-containing protein YiiM
MTATVLSIHRVAKKDGPTTQLSEAHFVADFGLEGDWRARPGRSRQITLIEEEALLSVAQALGLAPPPPGASRRQVLVRGIALNALVGTRLRIGPVLVQVTSLCTPCNKMEARIGPGAEKAMAGRPGVCGMILAGGIIRPGDVLEAVTEP